MTTESRPNEHVLIGKRVFTASDIYSAGDTVGICAELWTLAGERDPERFVVAHSFPIEDPARITQRVLHQAQLRPARPEAGQGTRRRSAYTASRTRSQASRP